MYDEVQEEIATWEESLEKELKKLEKQVGLAGLLFQPSCPCSCSPQIPPHVLAQQYREQGTRLRFTSARAVILTALRTGHLPGPDQGRPKERSKGLDQERGYQGGNSVAVNRLWTNGAVRLQRDGKSTLLPR